MRSLIHARYIIGFDGTDHVLIHHGDVVFEGDRLLHVGPGWNGQVDYALNVGNALVAPGLIDLNAVADLDHALLDSWASAHAARGLDWSEDYFRLRRHDVFSPDERVFIREYALTQLLLHGVTTCMPIAAETHSAWAESLEEMIGMCGAAQRLGIRAYLGPSYRAGVRTVSRNGERNVLWNPDEGKRGLKDALQFLSYVRDNGGSLVQGVLLPCRIETLTEGLMAATARAAEESGALVRLHCLQDQLELQLIRRDYDVTPVGLLRRAGLLGPRLLLPHGIYLGGYPRQEPLFAAELEELAQKGVSVVHCPLTSIRYGVVLQSFDRYLAAGVNIAIGSDSYPPDLIRAMDYGNNLAKLAEGRLDAGTAADYFRAATLGGARALGRDDLGRLAPGAQADLVVFDLGDPRLGVVDDPLRTILMNGSPRDIRMSVVAGRTVVRDGTVPGTDPVAMRRRAQFLFERMRTAYSERDYQRRSADQLFPASYRTSAARAPDLPLIAD